MGLFNRSQNDQPNKLTLEANGMVPAAEKTVDTTAETAVPTTPSIGKKPPSTLKKRPWKKYAIIGGIVLGVLLIVAAVLTLTGLDLSVMQPYLKGKVLSEGQPVEGATIRTGGKTTVSGNDGSYTMEGLIPGQYDFEVTADGYEVLTARISIARSYLSYANYYDFELKFAGSTTVLGKIVVSDSSYEFLDDEIVIGEQVFKLNRDGTFRLTNVPGGRQTWEYRSLNYKDIMETVELEAGTNDLGEYTTTPAGDLVASTRSYVTETVVTDLVVVVEGVEPEQTTISEDGILRVKDLEIAKQYRIQISHPQYQSRQYTATSKQGESQILNFRVVEKGKVPFLRSVDRVVQLMASDYDGENAVQLTAERHNPRGEFLEGTQVYFSSDKDGISSNIGAGKVAIPYVVSLSGGAPQRVMNEFTTLGRVLPNFKAKKLLNVRRGDTTQARILEIAEIDGSNRRSIMAGAKITFNDIILADSGRHIAFTMVDLDDDKRNGLYWSNLQNDPIRVIQKPNVVINDISSSGDRILYTTTNAQSGITDLYVYIVSEGKDTLIRNSWRGAQAQFFGDSESELLFFELRDGASNIFQLNLTENKETRLSTFTTGEGVELLQQQSGLIVYQTNRGLYLMSETKPLPGKLITTNYTRASGS